MQRNPRLRLGFNANVSGAGSLILDVRRRARTRCRSGCGREAGGVFDRLSSLIGADQISED